MSGFSTSVTLRARLGSPLSDPGVRDMVIASANAIAERTGVALERVEAEPDRVHVTIATDRLGAIGFAAELRRVTNTWHTRKYGVTLWGADPEEAS